MHTQRQMLLGLVLVAVVIQLRRVPRFWAFLFLFVILFPKIALATVPGNSTPLRVDDVVLGVVLGGWLVREALVTRARPVPASPLTPLLLLYLACAALSTLVGIGALRTSPATGALHFTRFVEYTLLYYYFYRTIEPEELPKAVEVFLSTWLIVVFVWVVQHWTADTIASSPIDGSSYSPSFSATYDFGAYAMIATAFCYALWTDGAVRDLPITVGLLAGLYVVFNGDSRASLLGLAAAIAFDLFLRLRLRVAAGLIAVAAVVPYAVSSEKMTRLFETLGEFFSTFEIETLRRAFFNDPSIGIRLTNWQMALEHWRASPLLGDGLGAFLSYVKIYDQQGTPDGWYIRTLAETGLLGLFTFMLIIGGLLWTLLAAHGQLDRPRPRAMVYATALALVAATTNALLIDTFVSYKIMGVFWMLMAVGTRLAAAPAASAELTPGAALVPHGFGSPSPRGVQ